MGPGSHWIRYACFQVHRRCVARTLDASRVPAQVNGRCFALDWCCRRCITSPSVHRIGSFSSMLRSRKTYTQHAAYRSNSPVLEESTGVQTQNPYLFETKIGFERRKLRKKPRNSSCFSLKKFLSSLLWTLLDWGSCFCKLRVTCTSCGYGACCLNSLMVRKRNATCGTPNPHNASHLDHTGTGGAGPV